MATEKNKPAAPAPDKDDDQDKATPGGEGGDQGGEPDDDDAGDKGPADAVAAFDLGAGTADEDDDARDDDQGDDDGEGDSADDAGDGDGAGDDDDQDGDGGAGEGDDGKAKAAAQAKKDEAALSDPITEKGKTAERMQTVIGIAQRERDARAQVQKDYDELVGYVASTGASPEQYAQALDYLRLINSGKPEDAKAALSMMREELANLALALGEDVPGVDLLDEFEDLREEVETGDISRARALEIARTRKLDAASKKRNETEQTQQQQVEAVNAGKASLTKLGNELVKRDGAETFEAKRKVLVPALKPVLQQIPPAQWRATFLKAYEELVLDKPKPKPKQRPQPHIGKQPAGAGGPAAPKSAVEAMEQAIGD